MLKGFKDFILRGNVVDLAVAVVIGAAFSAIVTSFTSSLINPLVNSITPPETPGLGINVIPGRDNTYLDFAAVVTAGINFLIVAAVVYFVFVLPLQTLKNRRRSGEEGGPVEPTDVALLIEIRDLLAAQANGQGSAPGQGGSQRGVPQQELRPEGEPHPGPRPEGEPHQGHRTAPPQHAPPVPNPPSGYRPPRSTPQSPPQR